ncbi:MAG: flagellar motor switch protein FliN [Proteobacteria bacterium]|nr:flagellar motor switch protein FliN [Pseudomonadota bacterium]
MANDTKDTGLDLQDLGDDMAAAMAEQDAAEKAAAPSKSEEASLEAVYDIPVTVSAVLGNTKMHIHQLLKLGRGAVVELDRKVGEAIDIYVNDRLVARGEVVIVDDKLGVTMTEIVKSAK